MSTGVPGWVRVASAMRSLRGAWLLAATLASVVAPSRGDGEVSADAVAPGSAAGGMYFFVSNKVRSAATGSEVEHH